MEIARLQIAVDATGARAAKTEIRDMTKAADAADSSVSKLVKSAAGLAIFGTAAAAVSTAVKASRDFNLAISQLSSITGAVGQDLAFYEKQAKLIGQTTTLSASQAADAFKLIASAKPDLLASRDALAAVTKEAVALAEAAGTSLPDAAKALGNSLNQFGADASEASRYINVLAAGAKFGSSAIEDTTAALKASGSAARAVGATFEQANAAIQALAKGGIAGAEAGTNLRNILLKLEADNNTKLRPSVVGVTDAIQNLAKEQLGVTELTKKFGLESVVAAQTLIDNASAVGQLETALTGTNTAYEQARTNSDNLAGDQKALQSATEALAIAFGQKLDPAVRDSTQTMTAAVLKVTDSIDAILVAVTGVSVLIAGKFVGSLAASASALIAQSVAAARATVTVDTHGMAIARTTVAANAGAIASRGLAAAMSFMGGPIGLAVSGVAALVIGIKSYQDRAIMAGKETRTFTHSINQMSDAASRAQERFAGLLGGMQNMTKVELEGKLTQLEGQLKTVLAQGKSFERMFERGVGTQAMIDGNTAAAALLVKEIEKVKTSLNGQAGAAKLSEAEMKAAAKASNEAAKEASALGDSYQSLYDSLYPAEAAQRQYNEQVALLSKYLTGDKLAAAISKLNESIGDGDHDAVAKAIEDYRKEVETLEDRLDPVGKATKQYQKDVALLASAHERGEISGEKYATMLATLEGEYAKATEVSGEWAQWTESALERVDGAFADAWKNIGDGFSGFRDSLTNAFKQMLAELAHMAITKPIVMQIGAALGIGGGSSGGGLLSSVMGGGSGGGMDFGKILNYGQSIYSGLTGVGPAVLAGYQSGGIGGALSGGAGYYGNLAGNAASTVGGWFGMGGGAAASSAAGSTAAGYTGSAYSAWAAGQGGAGAGAGLGGLGALAGPAAAAFAALQAYKAYGDGVRLEAKDTRGNAAAWATGYQPLAELNGAISKLTEKLGIGGALGNILNIPSTLTAMVGSALFGGGWQTKNAGLALGVQGGVLDAKAYEDQKKKGGLFSSNKKRTRYYDLDPETAAALGDAYAATADGVFDLFESLSFTIEDSALAGLDLAKTNISTMGKTEEEIQQAIAEWFGSAADAMTAELNKVFATGLDLDFEGMQAFVGNLQGVNEVLRYLDVSMYDMTVAGGKLAEQLAGVAGGLDALATNSQTYYNAFFTEAEKVEDTLDAVTRAFESADVTLAGSRSEYRAMVEDIDLTTEAGREMFATMMALSGQAATYYSIVEQQAAQAASQALENAATFYGQFTTAGERAGDMMAGVVAAFDELGVALPATRGGFRAVVDALDTTTDAGKAMFDTMMSLSGSAAQYYSAIEQRSANTSNAAINAARGAVGTLSAAINAEKSSITSAYQSQSDAIRSAMGIASDAVSDMRSVAGALRGTVNGLRIESEQYAMQSRRNAQSLIGQTLSGGGRLQMTAQLERALDTVSQPSEDLFGSFEDYARDYWQTYFAIESLADKADDQLTADERTVKALETQLDQASRFHSAELERLDGVLEGSNAQLEALLGINSGVLSVEAALAVVASSIGALKQLQSANSSITSVTGLAGVKRQVTSEGYILDELGNQMELFGEALRVVGGKVVGGAGSSLNIGADGQLSWAEGDYERWAKQEGIPGFASGGMHAGGLRIVGENGPEIEATGPSRIFNAGQTADMLGGGGQADEVAAMRAEMTDALRAIAKHTQQTARRVEYLERWDFDGLPEQRAAV